MLAMCRIGTTLTDTEAAGCQKAVWFTHHVATPYNFGLCFSWRVPHGLHSLAHTELYCWRALHFSYAAVTHTDCNDLTTPHQNLQNSVQPHPPACDTLRPRTSASRWEAQGVTRSTSASAAHTHEHKNTGLWHTTHGNIRDTHTGTHSVTSGV